MRSRVRSDRLIDPLPSAAATRYIRSVFWLTRPPYLRWAAAAALIVAALMWDLRSSAEVLYPFTSRAVTAGARITETEVEWRRMPEGAMALPDLSDPIASRDLPAGEPILPSAVSATMVIPEGWWSVPVPLPTTAVPGTAVHLIDTISELETDGIVVTAGSDDLLSFEQSGMVAVAPEAAAHVAIAAREGTLVVLLGMP